MTPVLIRAIAAVDIEDAFDWYEQQRSGLGDEFRFELKAALQRLVERPNLYPVVHRDTRRILLRRFPYGVFYRTYPQLIVVVAVMHGGRVPARWKSRR